MMSLTSAITALEEERAKLLHEATVHEHEAARLMALAGDLRKEALKLEEAIKLIKGVSHTPEAEPVQAPRAPEPAGNGHQRPMATEATIRAVLHNQGPLTLEEVVQAVIQDGREQRPAIIEAALYQMVKRNEVSFLKSGHYALTEQSGVRR